MDSKIHSGGAGSTSPALDGSAMIPDCLINGYINHLSWSDQATDHEKTLVAGNIQGFAIWLRTHMYGLYTPIYTTPNAGAVPRRGSDVGTSPLLAVSESGDK